jgi:hypothetical protein
MQKGQQGLRVAEKVGDPHGQNHKLSPRRAPSSGPLFCPPHNTDFPDACS